jgi:hypothetical protein
VNFVHIPKTGGSTAALLIKSALDLHHPKVNSVNAACATRQGSVEKDKFCATSPAEALALPPAQKCFLLASCGLSHKPAMGLLLIPGVINIVLLREPVLRQLSGFFHGYPHSQKTCGSSSSHHHGNCETLEAHFLSAFYDNAQTRMLGRGVYPYGGAEIPLTDADEAAAIANLGRFEVVGLNEHFESSIALLLAAVTGRFPKSAGEIKSALAKSLRSCDRGAGGWEVRSRIM